MRTASLAILLFLTAGGLGQSAMARDDVQTEMHPTFEVLDPAGLNIAEGGWAPDAQKTCGQCHDTRLIETRNTHGSDVPGADCFTCHVDDVDSWTPAAVGPDGKLRPELVTVRRADDQKCARCHGLIPALGEPVVIPEDYERLESAIGDETRYDLTRNTGAIYSGDKISDSYLNIEDRDHLTFSWDVHAQRKLGCTSCHHAANNPTKSSIKANRLPYLIRDPRLPSISEYVKRPDHNLTADGCERCHDPGAVHDFLPQRERHLEILECQSCHIPRVYGPALEWEDATVVTPSGDALQKFRGMDSYEGPINSRFSSGHTPYLFPFSTEQGEAKVGPFNMTSRWFWVDQITGTPLEPSLVRTAYLEKGGYAPAVLEALDRDGDGTLTRKELYLETEDQVTAVASRLSDLGVASPAIRGVLDANPLSHGVTNGKNVVRSCESCHAVGSRLTGDLPVSSRIPGGILPQPGDGVLNLTAGYLDDEDGSLTWRRGDHESRLYVFGHSRAAWSDKLGLGIFALVILVLGGHAAYRFRSSRGRASSHGATRKVYMYRGYERIWHWLMAASIITLMLTGFEIHYPETFGFLGFETAVAVHNFVAVVMVLNAFLSLFYHLASSDIRQFVPERTGLVRSLMAQLRYYSRGIFLGQPHPVTKDLDRKLNPLQQVTYLGLLNVLFPLQVITGALIWISSRWPDAFERLGGLTFVGPVHNLGSWLFLTFLVMHVYLTTTGHTLLSNIKAMVDGFDEIDVEPGEATSTGETNA